MAVFNGAFPVLPGKADTARAFAKETMGRRPSGYDERRESHPDAPLHAVTPLPGVHDRPLTASAAM